MGKVKMSMKIATIEQLVAAVDEARLKGDLEKVAEIEAELKTRYIPPIKGELTIDLPHPGVKGE